MDVWQQQTSQGVGPPCQALWSPFFKQIPFVCAPWPHGQADSFLLAQAEQAVDTWLLEGEVEPLAGTAEGRCRSLGWACFSPASSAWEPWVCGHFWQPEGDTDSLTPAPGGEVCSFQEPEPNFGQLTFVSFATWAV